jgi:hypothetical protein
MLPLVMGMPCQSVVDMLLMTLRYVMECKRFFLRMFGLLCKRLLFEQKVDMNEPGLVEMHPFPFKN